MRGPGVGITMLLRGVKNLHPSAVVKLTKVPV